MTRHSRTGKHTEKTSVSKRVRKTDLGNHITVKWGLEDEHKPPKRYKAEALVEAHNRPKRYRVKTLKGGAMVVKTIDVAGNPQTRKRDIEVIDIAEVKKGDALHWGIGPAVRFKPASLKALVAYTAEEIYSLVVPKRTLARRQKRHEPLTIEETDKALRLARIASLAEQVFGSEEKAGRWLRKPKRSLDGETPLVYLASESGARVVEEMLTQIDSGIVP